MGSETINPHTHKVLYLDSSPNQEPIGDCERHENLAYMTSAEVERCFSLSTRSLRFYEFRGIVKPDIVDGVRSYSPEDIKRLDHVRQAKQLGYTLREAISAILDAERAGTEQVAFAACPEKLKSQILQLELVARQIERQLSELRRRHYLIREIGGYPD